MLPDILLIDESHAFRSMLKNVFRSYHCEVIEADNGRKGLVLAAERKPDLIILDADMPVMNGVEVLRKLKGSQLLKNIPVMVVTSKAEQSKVIEFAKLGISGYFVKPLKEEDLIDRVRNFLALQPSEPEPSKEQLTDRAVDPTSTVEAEIAAKCFVSQNDMQFIDVPGRITKRLREKIEAHLHPKLIEMTNSGMRKLILNLSQVSIINIDLIKLTVATAKKCRQSNCLFRVVAAPDLGNELAQFSELSTITIDSSVEEAMTALGPIGRLQP
jgi:response regulator RpfG family c-di-GMP phosphodiesterase